MARRKAARGLAAVDPWHRSSAITHHETVTLPYPMNDATPCVFTVPLNALRGHITDHGFTRHQKIAT